MEHSVEIFPSPMPPFDAADWVGLANEMFFELQLERAFCAALAHHANDDFDFIAQLFRSLDDDWRGLTGSPQGWTALARVLCVPGFDPLFPTVH
jgi:hypothetical protein